MTTLISVQTVEGVVGQCDARCYDAMHQNCHCICGGMNHGAGETQALENTAKYSDDWVEAFEERTGHKLETKRYGANETSARQKQLF